LIRPGNIIGSYLDGFVKTPDKATYFLQIRFPFDPFWLFRVALPAQNVKASPSGVRASQPWHFLADTA